MDGIFNSHFLNEGAYFQVTDDYIKAKYSLFGKIDCRISDIDFVTDKNNCLIIRLKNGKCHTVYGLTDARKLCFAIRKKMSFESAKNPEEIFKAIEKIKSEKKKNIIYIGCCFLLILISIFVTVFLTDFKEMHQFNKNDWTVFAAMSIILLAAMAVAFYFAEITGKKNIVTEKLQYTVRRTIIETSPLLYDKPTAVFTNIDYTVRYTVSGFPVDNTDYYISEYCFTEEELDSDFTLTETYENRSDIFDKYDGIDFRYVIDITSETEKST